MCSVPFKKPGACFLTNERIIYNYKMVFGGQKRKKVSWSPKIMIRESPKGMTDHPRSISDIQGTALLEEENVRRKRMFKKMLRRGAVVPGTQRQGSLVWKKQVMSQDWTNWLINEYRTQTSQ